MRKRLLVVALSRGVGGGEIYLSRLLPGTLSAGFVIHCVASDGRLAGILRRQGTTVALVRPGAALVVRASMAALWALIRFRPDTVLLNGHLSLRLAWAGLFARVVHVVHVDLPRSLSLGPRLRRILLLSALGIPARVLAVSEPTARFLSRRVRGGRSRVRHLPAWPERAHLMASADRPLECHGEGLRVLAVGRLVPEKGFADLIRACVGLAGAAVVVAGEGPESFRLASLAARTGVRLELLGFVDDMTPVYERADVFVLPSRDEGCPLALMEAMAMGLPCICADIDAARALAIPEESALMYEAGNVAALRHALERVVCDPVLARILGRAARTSLLGYLAEHDPARSAVEYLFS